MGPKFFPHRASFESVLQYRFRTKSLFLQAVLHRSYLQFAEVPEIHSNERLEFLGDSILNMVVAERLYRLYPDAEEGDLTIMRAQLVNRKALVYYAKKIQNDNLNYFGSCLTISSPICR